LARYSNFFEQGCERSTADYIQIGNEIVVLNTCQFQDGSRKQIVGRLKDGIITFNYELDSTQGRTVSGFPGAYNILWTDYSYSSGSYLVDLK